MKRLRKSFLAVSCFVILIVGFLVMNTEVDAASKVQHAIKAYNKLLKKQTIRWASGNKYRTSDLKFASIDINGDSVPELIIECPTQYAAEGTQCMYAYIKGKVKRIYTTGNGNSIGESYPSRKVFVNSGGRMGVGYKTYLVFSKGKVKEKAEEYFNIDTNKYTYYVDGKKVKKAKYTKYIKKLIKGKKSKSFVLRANTAYNRKKYL